MKPIHFWILSSLLLVSCASFFTAYDKKALNDHKEFHAAITVEEFNEAPSDASNSSAVPSETVGSPRNSGSDQKSRASDPKNGLQNTRTQARSRDGAPSVPVKSVSAPAKKLHSEGGGGASKSSNKGALSVTSPQPLAGKTPKVTFAPTGSSLSSALAKGAVSATPKKQKIAPAAKSAVDTPLAAVHSMKPAVLGQKEPDLEDAVGFIGRRPEVDPVRVGEKTVLSINYFKVEAGRFAMSVKPFKRVNGKKAYHFHYSIKTSSLFSLFYKVDDVVETFVDYDLWRPFSYEVHVKQSKQVRETKSFFDWEKLKGVYLDRKKAPDKPLVKTKREWDILPWSQNVFSVAYYLRSHTLKVGKVLKVRVGHEGKNLLMSAKVLRKERLKTAVGTFDAFVVRPTFTIDGLFKATGNNLLWLSADERKTVLRLESKIKIGTIVGQIEELKR